MRGKAFRLLELGLEEEGGMVSCTDMGTARWAEV